MEYVRFDDADHAEPEPGWRRAGLVRSDAVSVDWFRKPSGHTSEMHEHEHEQVFVVLDGEFILHTEDDSVRLSATDAARVDPWERHYSENPGERPCIGLNVFAPGRTFPYWTD